MLDVVNRPKRRFKKMKRKPGLTTRLSSNKPIIDTWEQKLERIRRVNRPTKVEFIWDVERAWFDDYHGDPMAYDEDRFLHLYAILFKTVKGKSKSYARKFQNGGYNENDFASVMWDKVWRLSNRHQPFETNYFLFETVCVSLGNAVLKHLRREADRRERESEAWEQWKSQCKVADTLYEDWERHAVNRMLVQQILHDDVLTDDERTLLRTIYDNPDESLRDIGVMLGHPNHMTAVRMLEQIKRKLKTKYSDALTV